ncbi:Aldo/keto reductase [Tothia fuscella]|uniref:Aldo/keto reductase n=1 Tax=Tothia fuscella TaxID=1048955 RepID=A0A9P4NKL9_9PEZI|nr:Aldo/keto reductase [Tothia fuscella]
MRSVFVTLFVFVGHGFSQRFSAPIPPKSSQLNEIPQLGLGTWYMFGDNATEAVAQAIVSGYGHIHCAKAHEKEEFALKDTLGELGLDYLDLFLVPWPKGNSTGKTTFDYISAYKGMEELVQPKIGTRFVGISNFNPTQWTELLKVATIKPKVHQFELYPYLQQPDYLKTNLDLAPLGNTNPVYSQGYYGTTAKSQTPILAHTTITSTAKDRECTPAQVVLAWKVQRKVIVIPKATAVAHQQENTATLKNCKLGDADVKKTEDTKVDLRVIALPCRDMEFHCFDGMAGAPFCKLQTITQEKYQTYLGIHGVCSSPNWLARKLQCASTPGYALSKDRLPTEA